jgi:hypothetical protein
VGLVRSGGHDSGLSGESDLVLALVAVAASAGWLVAAAAVLISRAPPQPPVGPRTLELGAEPPAVANLLTHGTTPCRRR